MPSVVLPPAAHQLLRLLSIGSRSAVDTAQSLIGTHIRPNGASFLLFVSALRSARRDPLSRVGARRRVDGEALRAWIEPVRDLLTQQRRLEVGLTIVGQVLAFAPVDGDGIWPAVAVRDLIEELADENLDGGVVIGLFNRRGATVRNPAAGGTQETSLAQTYLEGSESLADRWPRTAAMLRTVADGYDRDARRQEERAERFRRGHRLA